MKPLYVYPGSFCPPTRGHLEVVRQAAEMFEQVIVLCSTNEEKDSRWFTEQECVELWQTYALPANVKVLTLAQLLELNPDLSSIIMIRGIRDESDLDYEKTVVLANFKQFGMNKFLYLVTSQEFCNISSSAARKAAQTQDLQALSELVSSGVATRLMEKVQALT